MRLDEQTVAEAKAALDTALASGDPTAYSTAKGMVAEAEAKQRETIAARDRAAEEAAEIRCTTKSWHDHPDRILPVVVRLYHPGVLVLALTLCRGHAVSESPDCLFSC